MHSHQSVGATLNHFEHCMVQRRGAGATEPQFISRCMAPFILPSPPSCTSSRAPTRLADDKTSDMEWWSALGVSAPFSPCCSPVLQHAHTSNDSGSALGDTVSAFDLEELLNVSDVAPVDTRLRIPPPACLLADILPRSDTPCMSNADLDVLWGYFMQWYQNKHIQCVAFSHMNLCREPACNVIGCVNIRLLLGHVQQCIDWKTCSFCNATHEYAIDMLGSTGTGHARLRALRDAQVPKLRKYMPEHLVQDFEAALFRMAVFPAIYLARMDAYNLLSEEEAEASIKAFVKEWKTKQTRAMQERDARTKPPPMQDEARTIADWKVDTRRSKRRKLEVDDY